MEPLNILGAPENANLFYVDPHLIRGAELPLPFLQQLLIKEKVTRVLNLENSREMNLVAEQTAVNGIGVQAWISLPCPELTGPSLADIIKCLDIILAGSKTYLHCKHGWDRTGVVCACYQIAYLGYSLDQVFTDLRRGGMKEWWITPHILEFWHYWKEKTSKNVESNEAIPV